jgi:hypothetical protein
LVLKTESIVCSQTGHESFFLKKSCSLETINIIESKLDLKIDKVNKLLHQAANDQNFLKVNQAKTILNELKNIKNELQDN